MVKIPYTIDPQPTSFFFKKKTLSTSLIGKLYTTYYSYLNYILSSLTGVLFGGVLVNFSLNNFSTCDLNTPIWGYKIDTNVDHNLVYGDLKLKYSTVFNEAYNLHTSLLNYYDFNSVNFSKTLQSNYKLNSYLNYVDYDFQTYDLRSKLSHYFIFLKDYKPLFKSFKNNYLSEVSYKHFLNNPTFQINSYSRNLGFHTSKIINNNDLELNFRSLYGMTIHPYYFLSGYLLSDKISTKIDTNKVKLKNLNFKLVKPIIKHPKISYGGLNFNTFLFNKNNISTKLLKLRITKNTADYTYFIRKLFNKFISLNYIKVVLSKSTKLFKR